MSGQTDREKLITGILDTIKNNFDIKNKRHFPKILHKKEVKIGTIQNKYLFMIYFIKPEIQEKIDDYYTKYKDYFPGLFAFPNYKVGSAYSLNNSKNNYFKDNYIKNLYSFRIGKDSSFILENHKQTIQTSEGVDIDYLIDLAYVITFGKFINLSNLHDSLDILIKHSIKIWGER